MTIKVLIADDHPVVRDGLRFIIERKGDISIVAEASDGADVLGLADQFEPDVFILDLTMPKMNGMDTLRALLGTRPDARAIILSFHDSPVVASQAMEAGACGYLTKEAAGHHIVEAIHEVAAGKVYLSPDIARAIGEHVVQGAWQASKSKPGPTLSPQERRVLQFIAQGRSSKEIAVTMGRSVNTIHAHRKNLMAKLGIHKQTDLVRFAIKEGLTLP